MENKKTIGLGKRGWLLIIYVAIAIVTFQAFTNYPLNILADYYGGNDRVSALYSICAVVGIIIQLILGPFMGKMKSIKNFSLIMGGISLILGAGVMLLAPGPLWDIAYGLINITSVMYATFSCSILVGQWFPTRKGTVMGICTIAFPVTNGLLTPFANKATQIFLPAEAGGDPNAVTLAFLPFMIVFIVGWLIGLIFVKDFPEQCGAYRDNNKNMSPEIANKMLLQEIEDRKTTVWRLPQILGTIDFWLITIPMGFALMVAIAMMTQSANIIASINGDMGPIMGGVMIFGILGSYLLGLIDTKIGTRKSMLITTSLMIIAGILGIIGGNLIIPALMIVALFMGASSNYTVSGTMQYWRKEDFPSVFSCVNPVANIINSIGPAIFGMIIGKALAANDLTHGVRTLFIIAFVIGIVSSVLLLLFRPARIEKKDRKLRAQAGKETDDALVGRM